MALKITTHLIFKSNESSRQSLALGLATQNYGRFKINSHLVSYQNATVSTNFCFESFIYRQNLIDRRLNIVGQSTKF
jgi:hypothetical protein